MKVINILGYTITISRIIRKFPTRGTARRKLAHEVEDTRELSRDPIYPKIQRIKRVRLLVRDAGLMEAKEWVEIAFLDNGHGEIA